MTTIISSYPVKRKFESNLSEYLTIDKWLTQKTPPVSEKQIISVTSRNGVKKGNTILFIKYGKRNPSHFPEICIGNLIVSLVFYKSHKDINQWISALKSFSQKRNKSVLVLGMMKPFYLKWGEKIFQSFRDKRYRENNVYKHLADTTTRLELSQKLSNGCSLAIYVGHGRSRGWSGYRGFRWKHIERFEQKTPIGNMISLSCSSLKHDKEFSLPFGLQWVMEGRCCTFIGTWDSVQIKPLAVITNIFLKCLANSDIHNINELIVNMNKQIVSLNNSEVRINWSKFKLIGNPYQSL
jgi:hypothetical protein